jgi:isoquinoline 1-oxidoreductase
MDRRRFLIGTAVSGVGLFVGYGAVDSSDAAVRYAPAIWYVIDRTGIVTVHVTKAEMGQHIGTALAMMIAEELAVDWRDMRIDYPDPTREFGILVTAGSWSVAANYEDMRRYGAAGRIAMIQAGAKYLAAPRDECSAERGWVIHKASGKRVAYGALIAAGAVNREFSEVDLGEIELKPDKALTLIGTSPPTLDIPAKVNGTARFTIDCFVPNMLYAKIARPPLRAGCTPLSVDDGEAKKIAGYRRFVSMKDPTGDNGHYVMALAANYPAARAAAAALKIGWDKGPNGTVDDVAILARARALTSDPDQGAPWWVIGDAGKAMAEAATNFSAEYITAHVAHAGIEPESALVWRDGERWHAYAGSAFQTHAVAALADALDTDSASIALHQTYLGDPSGRRVETDALVACALAAKAAGRPVKLIFDRDDAMRFDFPRPLTYQKLSAGLDGKIVALRHDVCSAWPLARALPIALQLGADHKTNLDWSVMTGADSWYSVPNYEVRAVRNDLAQAAVPSGFLRGAATGFVFWALESFIDELSHRTGQDEIALRLAWLDGSGPNKGGPPSAVGGASRLAVVIAKAVEITGYAERRRARKKQNRGIGFAASSAPDRQRPSWTACVAEVLVDDASGAVRVEKLTVVSDVGTAVHRDGVLAQIESATLWGLSVALYEQAALVNGAFHQENFDTYPMLRFDQVPELEIRVVTGGQHPTGAGEPAMSVVAPAIANAIFNAVGVRVRDLPITPAKVLAALKKKK